MKKILFSLTIALVSAFFASCLGDTESTFEGSNAFAVVQTDSKTSTKYVISTSGPLTWSGISEYSAGDALVINYKANLSNYDPTGVAYMADYATILETFKVSVQKELEFDVIPEQVNSFKQLAVKNASPYEFQFKDRWEFYLVVEGKEGLTPDVTFYYNKDNQNIDATKDLKEDEKPYIIDAVLTFKGQAISTTKETKEKNIVARMDRVRQILQPKEIIEQPVARYIWIRYKKEGVAEPELIKGNGLIYLPAED